MVEEDPCALAAGGRDPLGGEYGIRDTYVGVPVQLGRRGVEKVFEIDLTSDERAALHASADSVKRLIEALPASFAPALA